jgi:hypothetical protein
VSRFVAVALGTVSAAAVATPAAAAPVVGRAALVPYPV